MADEISRLVVALAEAFGRKVSETTIEAYRIGLAGLSSEQLASAGGRALRECEYMPAPATVRRLAGERTFSAQAIAVSAWSDVERSFGLGAYKWVDFGDTIINATIRHLGGWPAMFERCATAESEKWYRHEFIRVYEALAETGVSDEATAPLPGLSEGSGVKLVNGIPMAIQPTPKRILCGKNRDKERERCRPKFIAMKPLLESRIGKTCTPQ